MQKHSPVVVAVVVDWLLAIKAKVMVAASVVVAEAAGTLSRLTGPARVCPRRFYRNVSQTP